MRKWFTFFIGVGVAHFSFAAHPAEATKAKQECVNLVNGAIEFYKTNGKDLAFAQISAPKGQFSKNDGEFYVFVYDQNGTVMAHGQNAQEIGLNKIKAKDKAGKYYVKERLELTKAKGEGWQDYLFKDPKSGKLAEKTSFVKAVDGYIFGCGVYK